MGSTSQVLSVIDWTSMAMVIAAVATAIATVVLAYLTRRVISCNETANRIAQGQNMPVLNFRVDRREFPAWIVENVGKGVAMNVLLAHETRSGQVQTPIRDYNTFQPGMGYRIMWINRPYKFVAQYTDIYENRFTATCVGNTNSIQSKWLYDDLPQRERRHLWQMVVMGEVASEAAPQIMPKVGPGTGFKIVHPPREQSIPSDVEGTTREGNAKVPHDPSLSFTRPEDVPDDSTADE
jgi:hypothetical protein